MEGAGNGMLTLERVALDGCDWERMDAFGDRVVFQTREWLEFVARTQRAEPVVAAVLRRDEQVGWFTGLVVRRFGVRILGSPFPGWTTSTMGFNLVAGASRRDAAAALGRFAFGTLRCAHVELKDRRLEHASDLDGLGFESDPTLTFELDLTAGEEELLGRMTSACRRAIRKSEREGVRIEVAGGTDFADEYFEQLEDVFAKQSLVPTYGVGRVRELIACLEPTGRLLMLRALSPDGRSIATALFPAFNGTAYFWGGASLRGDQILRPNEPIFWHAMRHWRARGMTTLDLGGGGDYKRKYGPTELRIPFFRRSRTRALALLRDAAREAAGRRQAWRGRRAQAS